MVARLDLTTRTATTLYEPTSADGRSRALTRCRSRRARRGLSEPTRVSGSVIVIEHAHHPHRGGPLAGPADGWRAWHRGERRFPLVLEHRRDPDRLRPDLAGRSARGAVARRRVHRRRRDHACLRDRRRAPRTVWTTHQAHGLPPELARFDQGEPPPGSGSPRFNDHIVEGRVFPDLRTIAWDGRGRRRRSRVCS